MAVLNKSQTGYTLIELMIGIVIGLIVLSGALYVYLQIFKASQSVMASTKLNREFGVLVDTVSGEIRRHGYSAASGGGAYQASSLAGLSIVSTASASCLFYGYDVEDNDVDTVRDSVDLRGFAYDGNSVFFATDEDSVCDPTDDTVWDPITDPSSILITEFDVLIPMPATSSTGSRTVYTRRVELSISGSDPKSEFRTSKDVSILIPNNVLVELP